MVAGRWKRRVKRRLLDFIARRGYDVEKHPAGFPPYRFLKRTPLGCDHLEDAKTILGGDVRCVFDVGAHVGQSAARYLDAFPRAAIHSFEPDPASYRELRAFADRYPRMTSVNAAVGECDGEAAFFMNKLSVTSSLLQTAEGANRFVVAPDGLDRCGETTVRVLTLDGYCAARGIERIDFLKLDTQGYELRVLDGARALLGREAVPLIYAEVGFVAMYEHQPTFPELYQYLYDRDYRLVWLYETSFHRFLYTVGANALFVHRRTGERLAASG